MTLMLIYEANGAREGDALGEGQYGGARPRRGAETRLEPAHPRAELGLILVQLTYKAEWAGGELLRVNPAYTSRTCSACGASAPQECYREYGCPDCGLLLDRDVNAARNILAGAFPGLPGDGNVTKNGAGDSPWSAHPPRRMHSQSSLDPASSRQSPFRSLPARDGARRLTSPRRVPGSSPGCYGSTSQLAERLRPPRQKARRTCLTSTGSAPSGRGSPVQKARMNLAPLHAGLPSVSALDARAAVICATTAATTGTARSAPVSGTQ